MLKKFLKFYKLKGEFLSPLGVRVGMIFKLKVKWGV
jgi:hypothetical protein